MNKHDDVVSVQQEKRLSLSSAITYAVAIAVSFFSISAYSAEIDTIGAGLSTEMDGVKALVISLFTLGAILLGLFAGYKYLKRGANSA